jgi:hypothetical protein
MDYNNYSNTNTYSNTSSQQQFVQNNNKFVKEINDLRKHLIHLEEVVKKTENLNLDLQNKNEILEK